MKERDITKLREALIVQVAEWEEQREQLDKGIKAAQYLIRTWEVAKPLLKSVEVPEPRRASEVAQEMNEARIEKVVAAIVESERVAPRTNGHTESSHEMVVRVALEMIAERCSPVLSGDLWNRVKPSGIKRANMSVILSNECGRVGGGRLRRVSIGLYDRADGQAVVAQTPAPRVTVKAIPEVGVPEGDELYDVVLELVTAMPNYPLQDVMQRLQNDYPTVGKGLLALYIADAKFERMSGVRPKRTQREHSQMEQLYEVDDGIEETDSGTAVIALHMMRGLFVKNTDKAGHPYQDSGRPDEQVKYLSACRMLLSGKFSIQQVSAQTGFELDVVVKLANDMRVIQEQMENGIDA